MHDLWQDIRLAGRALRKAPGMSAVAIVTLAVGIAAVSTIFSAVNAVFYRPLPFPDGERIVALSTQSPAAPFGGWSTVPLRAVEEIRRQAHGFERIAAFRETNGALALTNESRLIFATQIDSSVLPMLQAHPQRGRLITTEEIRSLAPVAMIGDSLWRGTFGADDNVVGRSITVDGAVYTVVGVLPREYAFYERGEILIPLAERPDSVPVADARRLGLIGKLRTGVSVEAARKEVAAIGARLAADDPQFRGWQFRVRDGMYERPSGAVASAYAWLIIAVPTIVLLVACTNVANLLFVRAAERRSEMAVRSSLGASRARLIRLLLAESVVLAGAAAALGTLLTVWGIHGLMALIGPANFPIWIRAAVDVRVLAFTLMLAFLIVAAIGLSPALEGTRLDLTRSLKAGGEGMVVSTAVTRIGRRGLVLEVALSVMLFVCASLLWRSYVALSSIDPGYPTAQLISPMLRLAPARYPDVAAEQRFNRALAERLSADPRVEGVAMRAYKLWLDVDEPVKTAAARAKAFVIMRNDGRGIYTHENPTVAFDFGGEINRWAISDSYFATMGLAIVRGRALDARDQSGSAATAVVGEEFARRVWPRMDAIGKTFAMRLNGTPITVVGVARDPRTISSRFSTIRSGAWPTVYLSERQSAPLGGEIIVRTRGDAAGMVAAIRRLVHDVDPQVTVVRLESMAAADERSMKPVSFAGTLLGVLALCALILSAIGTYGVVAYGVTLRTREIGLRIALGGTATQVVALFLRDGMRSIGTGLAIGLGIALGASQLLRWAIVEVSMFDPLTYAATLLFFGSVALLACWLPARRAARVQPMVALRGD